MKTRLHRSCLAALVMVAAGPPVLAGNPIIQTIYTADPAPFVHEGTVYLYTSHDEDELVNNFFTMKDWVCFTSRDMVNWTHHGAVASLRSFDWAAPEISGWGGFENGAWAPQAIERDGKWYLYCPLHGRGIGVLVADGPFGPFRDPLGKPLIAGNHIDPTVFIDDDGQAYLYWGNPKCWYVKLNEDMISYDTSIGEEGLVVLDMTVEQFGARTKEDEKRPTSFEEGPWLYKRKDLYYLFFAGGPIPEHIAYSTGPSAEGPWSYGGVVMPTQGGSFTNHPGVIDFKGRTYLFYHNAALPGGGGFKRSVCVDELRFKDDGSVVQMDMTEEGPEPVAVLDPYERVEAETIAWTGGVETASAGENRIVVSDIDDGDLIRVRNVGFGDRNPGKCSVSVASEGPGAVIEVRLGGKDAEPVAEIEVGATGGLDEWKTFSDEVTGVKGVHDIFFTFRVPEGGGFRFDCWKFH